MLSSRVKVEPISRKQLQIRPSDTERDAPGKTVKNLVIAMFVRRVAIAGRVAPAIRTEPFGLARVHDALFGGPSGALPTLNLVTHSLTLAR